MDSLRIYVRQARAADREAVLRFTEHTYEWGDYIPMVWDRWFAEPGSEMLVAVVDRQPVAILHLVMVSSDEAWLEGMRVDVACRRLGIAKRVVQYSLKRAGVMGAKTVRFVTAADNTPAQHMAATFGFKKMTSIVPYFARALPSKAVLEKLSNDNTQNLLKLLLESTMSRAMGGLCSNGWRFRKLTPSLVEERIKAGMGRKVGMSGGITAFALIDAGPGLEISYLDGTPDALKKLVRGLRGEASTGYEHREIRAHLPEADSVRSELVRAGLKPMADETPLWLYELKI